MDELETEEAIFFETFGVEFQKTIIVEKVNIT
jgi:hypothetical protein